LPPEQPAPRAGEPPQRVERVFDLEARQAGDGRRATPHHGAGRALRPRLREEVVRVEALALQGHEQLAAG